MKTSPTPYPSEIETERASVRWIFDTNPEPLHQQIVIGESFADSEGGHDIAQVAVVTHHGHNKPPQQAIARARLIAAAPELLDALEMAQATIQRLTINDGLFSSSAGTLDVIRNAIRNATNL